MSTLNVELERTEELMRRHRRSPRTVIVITLLISIVVIFTGSLGVTAYGNKVYKENISWGDKYMEEGDYEQAAIAYEKSVNIKKKDIPSLKKLEKAHRQNGDEKKANDVKERIEKIEKQEKIERPEDKKKENDPKETPKEEKTDEVEHTETDLEKYSNVGNLPSNYAGGGVFLETMGEAYIANFPDGGSISTVRKDGTIEKSFDVGTAKYDLISLNCLSKVEDTYYFIFNGSKEETDEGWLGIASAKDNGNDVRFMREGAELLVVLEDKLYFTAYNQDTEELQCIEADLDGGNERVICNIDQDDYPVQATTDGELLIFSDYKSIYTIDPKGDAGVKELYSEDLENDKTIVSSPLPYEDMYYFWVESDETVDENTGINSGKCHLMVMDKTGKIIDDDIYTLNVSNDGDNASITNSYIKDGKMYIASKNTEGGERIVTEEYLTIIDLASTETNSIKIENHGDCWSDQLVGVYENNVFYVQFNQELGDYGEFYKTDIEGKGFEQLNESD